VKKMQQVDRRQFLKRSAAVAAAAVGFPTIIPASALGAEGRPAPSNRITMGCIGLGGQGTWNMKQFLGMPDVQVVALCDVEQGTDRGYYDGSSHGLKPALEEVKKAYEDRAKAGEFKGCDLYSDFRELLARKDIDTALICTPDHWHALITIAAARAGKDIYCEKPLANSIAEGRAVCETVKRYGRILQTGSHERSTGTVRQACELVRNGRLGKLHTIQINMPNNDPHHDEIRRFLTPLQEEPVPKTLDWEMWQGHTMWRPYNARRCHFYWRFIMDTGGGEMTDRGAHIIDIGQLGNKTDHTGPIEIKATGTNNPDGPYNAFLKYEFEALYANGVRLVGTSNPPRGLKFIGDNGWIFINIHGGQLEASNQNLLKEAIGPGEETLGRSRGHRENFIDCVKTREAPMAPVEAGHRTASICHLLNIAMTLNTPIKWDPEKERCTNDERVNGLLSPAMRAPWIL